MANKNLFASIAGKLLPKPDSINEANGPAYALPPKHALGQYVATGCLNVSRLSNSRTTTTSMLK